MTRRPSFWRTRDWLGIIALVFALIQATAPILWMLLGSLKAPSEFYANPWGFPVRPRLSNYADAFQQAGVAEGLWNSLTVVTIGTLLLALTAGTTAYALARFNFRGKTLVIGLILVTMMVPPDVLTIPLFVTLRDIGLLGTLPGLACLYASGGFGMSVFLLRVYFLAIPIEVEEAARIDGLSPWGIMVRIIIPLALPGFASVLAIQAMGMWNDLYLSLVFVRDPGLATAPVGLLAFFQRDQIDWPLLLAALTTLSGPILFLFALLQRRFVEGIVRGDAR